jgi:hypothetical protein
MVDVKIVVLSLERAVTVPPIVNDEQDKVPAPEIVAALFVPAALFNVTPLDTVKVTDVFTVRVAAAPVKVKLLANAFAVTVTACPLEISTFEVDNGVCPVPAFTQLVPLKRDQVLILFQFPVARDRKSPDTCPHELLAVSMNNIKNTAE